MITTNCVRNYKNLIWDATGKVAVVEDIYVEYGCVINLVHVNLCADAEKDGLQISVNHYNHARGVLKQ